MFIAIIIILSVGFAITGCIQASSPAHDTKDDQSNSPPSSVSDSLQKLIETEIQKAEIPGIVIEVITPEWTWQSAAGNASPITGESNHG